MELIIYITLLSLFSVMLANAYVSLTRGRGQAETRSNVNANIRFVFDVVTQDVKNGGTIQIPASAGATSSTLQMTQGATTTTYDVNLGRIRRTAGLLPPEWVTADTVSINSLVFTRIENYQPSLAATTTSIKVELGLRATSTSAESAYARTVQTTITAR